MNFKHKRIFAVMMIFLLLFPSSAVPVLAVDTDEEAEVEEPSMIDISSDWQGSVMGDTGTDDINYENYEITEHEDASVTMRVSNNRGKMASGNEGLAYYFKQVDPDENYEMTATAHVDSIDANNQVGFGIMLRSNILMNERDGNFTGDYVAVGGIRQDVRGFYKYADGGYQYPDELDFNTTVPASGEEYQLSIRKVGDIYQLKVNGETQQLVDYDGEMNYAGLFASRNVTVTYSDINLQIDGQVELGDWDFSAFGSNTSIVSDPIRNTDPTLNEDGSVFIEASGGKISSSEDGISFYHKGLSANANFEIHAKAKVHSFTANNQVSFGLMVRDQIGGHGDSGGHEANYVSVGALDQVMKGFYKKASLTKLDTFAGSRDPATDEVYDLSIRKSGDMYVVSSNGVESDPIHLEDTFMDEIFVGLYVARGAAVTFSDFDIDVDARTVADLQVDATDMKTSYLVGEDLDLTGLNVTAVFSDGSEQVLSEGDYIVTGFDSSEVGENTITLNYNGKTATVVLDIESLDVTDLQIKYFPAKTDYYKGDTFDPQGFVVIAEYNHGFAFAELTEDLYRFSIAGEDVTDEGFIFENGGPETVTVRSTETEDVTTTFTIVVKEANLTEIELRRAPTKTLYFLGDELDLSGMSVYAIYSDGAEVRLMADEYAVSNFDSSVPDESQALTISHKGEEVVLTVRVKERELEGIEVTDYPKTTFYVNDAFESDGLVVSEVYDNGDLEVLATDAYTIDSSGFDASESGTYGIDVVPDDVSIDAITYQVTVRDETEVDWKTIRFGQSTSDANNTIDVRDDGTVEIVALEGGGKITGDHDGISFYYTEIDATEDNFTLSANVKVTDYAKTPHDGQESFGIMARDALGPANDAGVFASNIAAVGGFSGGTRDDNGTQAFVRTGVLASDGEGSEGIQKQMLHDVRPSIDNTYPAEEYRLTLEKTNSGYIGKLNDGDGAIFFEPELLNVQDDKVYVGFYTARLATIEVSDIVFDVTASETDAPKVEPPMEPVTPDFEYVSLGKTSLEDYTLMLKANVDGVVTVKQGHDTIARDQEVKAGELVEIAATLLPNSDTNFSTTFLPDDTQLLTSYDKIVHNVTVSMKTFGEGGADIYVSPTGTSAGDGTKEDPLTIDTAIDYVKPGQTIYVMEGTYVRDAKIEIKKFNDGTEEAMKYLVADPDASERPLIDFDKRSEGVVHSGNYWHVKGIDFARSAGNTKGYTIGGSHNIIENVVLYEHGDTGLQISRTDTSENDKAKWPSHNLILHSVSYDNRDPAENNADGFAAKLTVGVGNVFDGNISHNNIDDGWDLYTKVGTGAIGPVTIRNSIAFNNGTLSSGYVGNAGKNGFKLGGEGVHVPHVIENSIAFGNGAYGFTSNSNPGVIANSNIGWNNDGANLSLTTYNHIETDFMMDGFASYRTDGIADENDSYPAELASDINYLFQSGQSENASGDLLSEEILESMEALFIYDDAGNIVSVNRNDEGEIVWGDLWEVYNSYMGIEEEDPVTPPGEGGEEEDSVTPPGEGGEEEDPVTPPGEGGEEEDPVTPPGEGGEEEDPVTPPGEGGEEEDPVTPPGEGEEEEDPVTSPGGSGDGEKSTDDKDEDGKKESSKDKDKSGSNGASKNESKGDSKGDGNLPDTNTGIYNGLIVGLMMFAAGLTLFITRKRKENETV
ncbi:bacterial Ig-like domain-containing protein [Salipaludibacillus sp. HK11]|uniref:bacterial Ig-like domain-containing protein n=1 Tax=Salipaludibacillus sp. HK11 TaxID=3394320 RepID=UPI0039FD9FB8